jgi:hypothetical protein
MGRGGSGQQNKGNRRPRIFTLGKGEAATGGAERQTGGALGTSLHVRARGASGRVGTLDYDYDPILHGLKLNYGRRV